MQCRKLGGLARGADGRWSRAVRSATGQRQTYVYQTIGTHDLKANVYAGPATGPRPVVGLRVHGGGYHGSPRAN